MPAFNDYEHVYKSLPLGRTTLRNRSFSFRLTAPYSEERREAARRYARENNAADRLK